MIVEIVFPYPPAALSPNSRRNFRAKARSVREYRSDCYILGLEARGKNRAAFPLAPVVTAQATFVVRQERKRDADNHLSMLKPLFDGLVDARVLAGDDATLLRHKPVVFEKGTRREVRVTLEGGADGK